MHSTSSHAHHLCARHLLLVHASVPRQGSRHGACTRMYDMLIHVMQTLGPDSDDTHPMFLIGDTFLKA